MNTKALLYIINIIMATEFQLCLVNELNSCRSNPRRYSSKLSNILSFYSGKVLTKPNRPPLETHEGLENVESCIKYLKTIRPSPPLKWSFLLSKCAQSHIDDIGPLGLESHLSSEGSDLKSRLLKFCTVSGSIGENIDFGNTSIEEIVINLLIDDGMLSRGQRLNIMKKNHKFVGAGQGIHSEYGCMSVLIFAEEVKEEEEIKMQSEFLKLDSVEVISFNKEYRKCTTRHSDDEEEKRLDEDFQLKNDENDLEISNLSVFQKDIDESGNISELSMSVSRTEMPSISQTFVKAPKSKPKNKPPVDPKFLKKQQEDFVVSNFDRSELSKDAIFEIKELFDIYDTSGSGFLDSNDIKSMKESHESINSEIFQAVGELVPEQIVALDFDDFLDLVSEKINSIKLKSISLSEDKSISMLNIPKIPKKSFDPTLFLRPELKIEDITEIKKAFDMFDVDNTGTINPNDLKVALKTQGYEIFNPTVFRMVSSVNADEKVNFGEFLDLMASEGFENTSADEIQKLFNIFDIDKTGYIELKNLKKIARELGEALDEEEIVEIIRKSDQDGDGRVSFADFYYIMNKQLF